MPKLSHYGIEHADHSDNSSKSTLNGSFSGSTIHQQPTDGRNTGRPEPEQGKNENVESLECGCTMKGRALVVCLDGTSNQFGKNNTNVIELYHRIVKNKKQLTYYNSGIGTYAKPSWRSLPYWKQVISNKIDTAIAWNFEKILLGAYRWLSANYEEGDRVYLFGFSRGAYQVRVLAAMIEKVGLILPGNEEQIPFAYELYADHNSGQYEDPENINKTFDMAARFKESFSRSTKVHFLGVWDTVSSIGLARSKSLPLTDTCGHFCYMRHALALDERRVKFQPEYARGGESWLKGKDRVGLQDKPKLRPQVKEVWFAGSHSDIGGGVKSNTELNNAAIPALWMGNEAMVAGLDLIPSRAIWDWDKLRMDRPTDSLSFKWRILEAFPFEQLSYRDADSTHRRLHFANPRIIAPGQKIHASVAFVGAGYHPKAKFPKDAPKEQWDNIVGKGNRWSLEWAHDLGDLLELDLFDHSSISDIMDRLNDGQSHARVERLERLAFMARNDGGPEAITGHPQFEMLFDFLRDKDASTKIATCGVLEALAWWSSSRKTLTDDQFNSFFNLLDDRDTSVKIATCKILMMMAVLSYSRFTSDQIGALFNLLDDKDAGVKVITCRILGMLAHRGYSRFTNVQFSTLFNLLGDVNGDAGVKITICSILEVLATQGHLFGNDVTPIIYRLIVGSNEKLQIAALKTLGGFQLNDIPPEVLAKIHGLVAPMLMDGTKEEDRLSATMALYSCIRESGFLPEITIKDGSAGISNLTDILLGCLGNIRAYPEHGDNCSRDLVELMEHGGSLQEVIAQNPRVAIALADGGTISYSECSPEGQEQEILAFSRRGVFHVIYIRSSRRTHAIENFSYLAVESDMPDVQRDVLLALKALARNDEKAKNVMGRYGLLKQIRRRLESDPRPEPDIDRGSVQSSTGVSSTRSWQA